MKLQTVYSIFAVPLFHSLHEDKLVWDEDRNSCYLIKSGYNLISWFGCPTIC